MVGCYLEAVDFFLVDDNYIVVLDLLWCNSSRCRFIIVGKGYRVVDRWKLQIDCEENSFGLPGRTRLEATTFADFCFSFLA